MDQELLKLLETIGGNINTPEAKAALTAYFTARIYQRITDAAEWIVDGRTGNVYTRYELTHQPQPEMLLERLARISR